MIDDEKLTEFNDLMGYYQIVTSELNMPDLEVIDKYHGLTRIEDQFREMKGTLETRPIYVWTSKHIQAHLMVCFMALTMMRVIQYKVKSAPPPSDNSDLNWSYGLPGNRIAKALANWQVDLLPGGYYRMLNVNSTDLKTILSALGISIPNKLFLRGDLRALKASAQPF